MQALSNIHGLHLTLNLSNYQELDSYVADDMIPQLFRSNNFQIAFCNFVCSSPCMFPSTNHPLCLSQIILGGSQGEEEWDRETEL